MATTGYSLYKLGFQVSPIILTQGVAALIPGGMLPIIAITESANFLNGLVAGNINLSLDDFFAQYQPAAGASLISNEVATYPFANQSIAANSIVSQPLNVGMLMTCPVREKAGYYFKLAIMSALQATLALHNSIGGLYTILTPSYIYTNCVMQTMLDVSSGETKQSQWQWQMQFLQPLLTLGQAQQEQGNLYNLLSSGGKPSGSLTWSSVTNNISSGTSSSASIIGVVKQLIGAL